ncbi:MAG: hypothetical protein WC447_01465 [Candidatus Paceibacterota bacterium]|jgi:hypothetical protein
MKNNIEGVQEPIKKPEEKEAEINEYARITTTLFFENFLKENTSNMETENFGAVHVNLKNGVKKIVFDSEKELGREYSEKLAGSILSVLNFYLWLVKEDEKKDSGIKEGVKEFLSEYIAGKSTGLDYKL